LEWSKPIAMDAGLPIEMSADAVPPKPPSSEEIASVAFAQSPRTKPTTSIERVQLAPGASDTHATTTVLSPGIAEVLAPVHEVLIPGLSTHRPTSSPSTETCVSPTELFGLVNV